MRADAAAEKAVPQPAAESPAAANPTAENPQAGRVVRPAERGAPARGGRTRLATLTRPCRSVILTLGLFSAIINVLMLTGPLYMLQIYDRVLGGGHIETLILLTVAAIGALLALGVFDGLRAVVAARMGSWIAERLAPVCLGAEMRRNVFAPGEPARALGYLGHIQGFLTSPSMAAFFDAPWAPFFIALVWLLHPWLGVVAVIAALALLGLSLLNEVATRSAYSEASQAQGIARDAVEEMLGGAAEARALGMEDALVGRWWGAYHAAVAGSQKAAERGGWVVAASKFTRFAVQVAVLGVGAILVLRGEITAGSMVAASILLGRALAPVEQAMGAWRAFVTARVAYGKLSELLEAHPEPAPRMRLPRPTGRLSVERVSAADPAGKRLVLNDVSFKIAPGRALAVLGPSGAGKSTLCRLLVGGVARKTGEVRLDGARLESWDPAQLGAMIGYMPQNVRLFSGTIAENIARFSEASAADVIAAAKAARAHEMILSLPDGYETHVGGGGGLSGGQQQRVGLARALFGAPPLLILDEPNANLDSEGEAALAAVIRDLKKAGAAVVIVGHRPSTIAEVDDILFLNQGAAMDYGPRPEVLGRMRAAQEARAAASGRPAPRGAARPPEEAGAAAPAPRPAPSRPQPAAHPPAAQAPAAQAPGAPPPGAPAEAAPPPDLSEALRGVLRALRSEVSALPGRLKRAAPIAFTIAETSPPAAARARRAARQGAAR